MRVPGGLAKWYAQRASSVGRSAMLVGWADKLAIAPMPR